METALVLHIAAADALTGPTRMAHDPSAADGMPAHVTLLYPFKPVAEITPADAEKLAQTCKQFESIELSFETFGRFPAVLWLAPQPVSAVSELASALVAAFPDWKPYGGAFKDFVPHLTLAHLSGADAEAQLDRIAADFMKKAEGQLPLRQTVFWVSLFDKSQTGRWKEISGFPLGQKASN
jgi:2'-5' RNA ligase